MAIANRTQFIVNTTPELGAIAPREMAVLRAYIEAVCDGTVTEALAGSKLQNRVFVRVDNDDASIVREMLDAAGYDIEEM